MSVERDFAERMALWFESIGTTRTMGLIYGWLTVCVPAHQSITELAAVLGISKASVSTQVRLLERTQMVERVPVPGSRQHHYQLRTGGWAQVMRARTAQVAPAASAAADLLDRLDRRDPSQAARVEEMLDFFNFVMFEHDALLAEHWSAYRQRAIQKRAAHTP